MFGSPVSNECAQNLSALVKWVEWLGFLGTLEKVGGPSTILTVLEVEINTIALVICLPKVKVVALRNLVVTWRGH